MKLSEGRQPGKVDLTRISDPKQDLVSLSKPKLSLARIETAITSREQHLAISDPDPLLAILCCSDPVTHNGVGPVMA